MRKSVLVLVVGVALGGAAPAQASTVIESENPRYQRWVDEAKVPTPDVTLRVVEQRYVVEGDSADGVTWNGLYEMWLDPNATGIRETFYHELGHNFDYYALEDSDRALFSSLRPLHGWDKEVFATSYAICALRTFRWRDLIPGVTEREQRGFCRALRYEQPGRTTVDAG